MRTNDPSVMTQVLFEQFTSGKYQTTQYHGVYIGEVVATSLTNPSLAKDVLQISIPSLSGASGWPPCPFPGEVAPPVGTKCIVSFEGVFGNAPRILSFVDWQSNKVVFSSTTPTYQPSVGDIWITP